MELGHRRDERPNRVVAEMIGCAGGVDLVRGGAVEQHRVTPVGAHHVVNECPDVPWSARGGSGPLVDMDESDAMGERIACSCQEVDGLATVGPVGELAARDFWPVPAVVWSVSFVHGSALRLRCALVSVVRRWRLATG